MTKKDYERIAAALEDVGSEFAFNTAERHAFTKTVQSVAAALKEDNPRFRERQFYLACGVDTIGWPVGA